MFSVADLLLHVVDVSHPLADQQIKAVNVVLAEMGCEDKDIVLVLNQMDCPGASERCDTLSTIYPGVVALSARTGVGVDKLTEMVSSRVTGEILLVRVVCSHSDGKTPSFLRRQGSVISETCSDSDFIIEVYLGRRQMPGLERLGPKFYEIVTPATS